MLNELLEQVKRAIFNSSSTPHQQDNDPDGLVGQIEGLFGQHQARQGSMENPLPASADPYGDPADQVQGGGGNPYQQFPNLRPASEDPYGDPADQVSADRHAGTGIPNPYQQFPNLRPASEDPYGDPADQERR